MSMASPSRSSLWAAGTITMALLACILPAHPAAARSLSKGQVMLLHCTMAHVISTVRCPAAGGLWFRRC